MTKRKSKSHTWMVWLMDKNIPGPRLIILWDSKPWSVTIISMTGDFSGNSWCWIKVCVWVCLCYTKYSCKDTVCRWGGFPQNDGELGSTLVASDTCWQMLLVYSQSGNTSQMMLPVINDNMLITIQHKQLFHILRHKCYLCQWRWEREDITITQRNTFFVPRLVLGILGLLIPKM